MQACVIHPVDGSNILIDCYHDSVSVMNVFMLVPVYFGEPCV